MVMQVLRKNPGRSIACGSVLLAAALAVIAFAWPRPSPHASPTAREPFAAAMSAIDRGNTALALRKLNTVLERDPTHGEALLYRGQLLNETGSPQEAMRDWQRIPDVPAKVGGTARYLEG